MPAGTRRHADPALVRHVDDLRMVREHVDPAAVVSLAREIARADAQQCLQ